MTERMRYMVETHGEACTMVQAGKIINRSDETIRRMVKEGRIRTACEGSLIDVRSLAEYIERPAQIDCEARLRKRREKHEVSCRWSV